MKTIPTLSSKSLRHLALGALIPLVTASISMPSAHAQTLLPDGEYVVTWHESYDREISFSETDNNIGLIRTDNSKAQGEYSGSALVQFSNIANKTHTNSVFDVLNSSTYHDASYTSTSKAQGFYACGGTDTSTRDDFVVNPIQYAGNDTNVQMFRLQPFLDSSGQIMLTWPITDDPNSTSLANDAVDPRMTMVHHVSDQVTTAEAGNPAPPDCAPAGHVHNEWDSQAPLGANEPGNGPGIDAVSLAQTDPVKNTFSVDKSFSWPSSSTLGSTVWTAHWQMSIAPYDQKPTANFSTTIHPGGKVEFDASKSQAGSGSIRTYKWSWGDGSPDVTTKASTITHTYQIDAKPWPATLQVSDDGPLPSDPTTKQLNICSPDVPAANGVEYSGLVKCVETDLQAAGDPRTPREMLSTLRRFYYNGQQWNDVIPCGLPVVDPSPSLDPKLISELRQKSVGGTDMTHIFEPLEAMECPSQNVYLHIAKGKVIVPVPVPVQMTNWDFAGWGGDIGQADVLYVHNSLTNPNVQWTDFIGDGASGGAPSSQLFGDLDGVAIHFAESGSPCSGSPSPSAWATPLSQVLNDYYSGTSGVSVTNRRQCLEAEMGIQEINGLVPNQSIVQNYRDAVSSFARFYYRGFFPNDSGSDVATAGRDADTATTYFSVWFNTHFN